MPVTFPRIQDVMDPAFPTFNPDVPIRQAVEHLLDWGVSGAPVVTAAGRLVGILSEKDCLRILSEGAKADVPTGTVADYMTRSVKTLPPEMDVYYAAGLFLGSVFRYYPVVHGDVLLGVVGRASVLRALQRALG
jgi:CBS domain-containing protein